MTNVRHYDPDPRMRAAIDELQDLIRSHFPTTTFTVGEADDPDGVYMRAVVDIDDTDAVIAVFFDRLVDFHVEDELPIYVVPVRTPERIAADLHARKQAARAVGALMS